MKKILLACVGNSCRSQMAEGFLREFDPTLEVYSAGIEPEKCVSPYAVKVMKESFIDISEYKTKAIENYLYMHFDHIITFSGEARDRISELIAGEYTSIHIPIDDPAITDGTEEEKIEKYREVRNKIKFEIFNFYLENYSRE